MVRLIFKTFAQHIKCELEYKASFIIGFISQIFIFFSYYFMIISLFSKFENLAGFSLYEVLLCFAIVQFGFAFTETFFRGVDKFEDYILDGELDRFFLRPRSVLFQIMISKIQLIKISRLIQSIIILVIALVNLKIEYTFTKVIVLISMLIGSIILFFSLFLLAASYCFLSVHGLEVKNILTDGSKHMGQYPIGIFTREFRIFYTFIIPFASVNYYPLLYFTGKSTSLLYLFSPLFVLVFLGITILIFNFGLKHYSSVGS